VPVPGPFKLGYYFAMPIFGHPPSVDMVKRPGVGICPVDFWAVSIPITIKGMPVSNDSSYFKEVTIGIRCCFMWSH
jgi:hypothetical protein